MKRPQLRLCTSLLKTLSAMAGILAPCAAQTTFAQTQDAPVIRNPFVRSTDVSVGVFGQLTAPRTPISTVTSYQGTTPTAAVTSEAYAGTSPSAGVLGTFHQSFSRWLGYNVNVGYTTFTENYSRGQLYTPTGVLPFPAYSEFAEGQIKTDTVELTVASVIEGPRTRRFSTFTQFGGGGLFFLPKQTIDPQASAHGTQQTRPAMVFGVGMNYKLSSHLDLRAEYRGLFYKSPDFNLAPFDGSTPLSFATSFPTARLFTVTNEPTISLVYRFGQKKTARAAAAPSR